MAATQILAAGQTAATSSDVTVAEGGAKTVGIFTSGADEVPAELVCEVVVESPGNDVLVTTLSRGQQVVVLSGPGTYKVNRPACTHLGVDVGAFTA